MCWWLYLTLVSSQPGLVFVVTVSHTCFMGCAHGAKLVMNPVPKFNKQSKLLLSTGLSEWKPYRLISLWVMLMTSYICNFLTHLSYWYHEHSLWNCLYVNATEPDSCLVNFDLLLFCVVLLTHWGWEEMATILQMKLHFQRHFLNENFCVSNKNKI